MGYPNAPKHTWSIVLRLEGIEVVEVKMWSDTPIQQTQRWVAGRLDPCWVVFVTMTSTDNVEAQNLAWDYFDRNAPDEIFALSKRKRGTRAEQDAMVRALRDVPDWELGLLEKPDAR